MTLNDGGGEFVEEITGKIVQEVDADTSYGDITSYLKPVLRLLFEKFGSRAWPIVGDAILRAGPLGEYRLQTLVAPENSFDREKESALALLPPTVLERWCASHGEAPAFVASAIETLIEESGDYRLSRMARFVLDHYGDDARVLSALSANMGSFGWSGSVVPYYEREVTALEPLLTHQRSGVREWAANRINFLRRQIEVEKVSDAEQSWGIR